MSRHARYFCLFHALQLGHHFTTAPPTCTQPIQRRHSYRHYTPASSLLTRRESNARTVPWWMVGVVLLKARAAVLALVRKAGRRFRASRESMVVIWRWWRGGSVGLNGVCKVSVERGVNKKEGQRHAAGTHHRPATHEAFARATERPRLLFLARHLKSSSRSTIRWTNPPN